MAHDIFISYSSQDRDAAEAVCRGLEAHQIRCWIAPRDIVPGISWAESIIDALESARAMLLLFSAAANASAQIHREVERAVHKGIPVIPVRLENVLPTRSMEYFISTMHWLDAQHPFDRHLERVVQGVAALLAKPGGSARAHPRRRRTRKDEPVEASKSVATLHAPPPAAVRAEPADANPIPAVLGNYEVGPLLGQGRFGSRVYAGAHRLLGSRVAIRTFRAGPGDNPTAVRERFLREARSLEIVHPNIIHVRDFGESGDILYVVTDLVGGCTLAELIARERQLSVARLHAFVQQLIDATVAVHERGGLISGLHPEIVRVAQTPGSERLMISSAGIRTAQDLLLLMNEAALRGQAVATELSYVAPELLIGRVADPRCDVFTVGALAYLMATGAPPFQAPSLPELLGAMLDAPPPDLGAFRPDLGRPAIQTISRSIAANARTRFETAAELAEAWRAATSA